MNVHHRSPIGVFDSGLGGLSVVRQLQAELPRESIIYAADSRYCPYGERSPEQIRERSLVMAHELLRQGAKMIITACNTATAASVDVLREQCLVPIVAMEPAVKPAVALTRSGKIAVLATPSTAGSARLRNLIARYGVGLDVRAIGVPGLADRIESGDFDGPAVRNLLDPRITQQVREDVDVLVLGCTHYPFAYGLIRELAGEQVRIIDSGNAVARRARDVLMQHELLAGIGPEPTLTLWTTGEPRAVEAIAARMLGRAVPVDQLHAEPALIG